MKSYIVHFLHQNRKYKIKVLASTAGKALDTVISTFDGANVYKVES